MREKGILLEHGVQRPFVWRDSGNVLALEQDGALGDRGESGNHPEHRGLSAAGRAQQGDELAFLYVEIYVIKYLLVAEGFGYMLDVYYDILWIRFHFRYLE